MLERTVLTALVAIATTAGAQSTATLRVAPDSKLWIDGTSNLHSWSCKATSFDASIELDTAALARLAASPAGALERVMVKVPVRALKCGSGPMENDLYKALDADRADASYIKAQFEAAPCDATDRETLHTDGALTIAGREKKIEMDVDATRLADGRLRVTGMLPVRMTDFGIAPPRAMFGLLRAGDVVKVGFDLTVGAHAIAAAAGER